MRLRLTALALVLALTFAVPVPGAAQALTRFEPESELTAMAFGDVFLCRDSAVPDRLYALDAEDGRMVAWLLLGSSSGAEDGLWMRTSGEYALVMTSKYAYRLNPELRVEARVRMPELPGKYSVSADLTSAVYQNSIHIERVDLLTGRTEQLLEGDYASLPQRIYSNPVYLSDESRMLVYENVGAEDPIPAVMDLESGVLEELGVKFDISSSWKLCGDRLLVCGGLFEQPRTRLSDDPFWFMPVEGTIELRLTGCYDLLTGAFIPLTIPLSRYGVQAMSVGETFVSWFADEGGTWRLCHTSLNTGTTLHTDVTSEVSNLVMLSSSRGGRVLYYAFDLQQPERNGYCID